METLRTPVFRRYDVVEKIGSGGMGTVYKARDTHLDRVVALKVLPPGLQEDEDALERFKREARALAHLKHPRVASVYDAHVEGGFPHLVMELVEGDTLEQLLKNRRSLTAEETARIGIDICEALEHIHTHRIVHRDVKSSNIIMEPRIGAVLADFGIALEASLPRISQGALGTPEYMSPEQAKGLELDGRSDLYSAGVVLFECLIGRTPFRRDGDSFASLMRLMKQLTDESVPPLRELRPEIPTWMADVVGRCLEKDPDRRFASAVELAGALREGLREAGALLLSEPSDGIARVADGASGTSDRAPATSDSASPNDAPVHGSSARGDRRNRPRAGRLRFIYSGAASDSDNGGVEDIPDEQHAPSSENPARRWIGDGGPAHARDALRAIRGKKDLLRRQEAMVISHLRPVQAVAFGSDGKRMASASDDGVVRIWQVSDGKLLHSLEQHEGSVSAVAFSPDGRYIASGDIFGKILLWDVATGRLVRTIDALTALVLALEFSPDGKCLASGGADRAVRLWNVRTGHLDDTVGWHLGYVLSAAFSPDGRRIATSGSDGQVLVWDVARKALSLQIQAHRGWAVGVDFSPDGQRIVSGGSDHLVNVWNAAQGSLEVALSGHCSGVMAAAFSPRGSIVASAGRDRTIRLWDVRSGKSVGRLDGHAGAVTALGFSADGRHLASGGDDRTARVWYLDHKAFGSRRPLRRMATWAAVAMFALAAVSGPLDVRQLDVGAAWSHLEEALPNLSGAALEGSFLSENRSADRKTAEVQSGEPADASVTPRRSSDNDTEHRSTDRKGSRPTLGNDRGLRDDDGRRPMATADGRPRATQLMDVPKLGVTLPTSPVEFPRDKLEVERFQPLYGGGSFVSDRPGWTIIVGSLRSLRGAKWLVKHYRELGFRSGIIAIPGGGAWEYLVGVGQFSDREGAEHAVARLRGKELPFRTQVDRLRWEYMTADRR